MAEQPQGPPESDSTPTAPDNVKRIHRLVRMMHQFDLTAIDLVEGETRIRLRRGGVANPGTAAPASPPAAVSPTPPPAGPAPSSSSAEAGTSEAASATKAVYIESPMVGTFYQAGSPDSPPYVNVGSVVRPETTVGIIEAMKVFTEIPAGVSGTIAEVLVSDKQTVEFGQPLFRVEPSS